MIGAYYVCVHALLSASYSLKVNELEEKGLQYIHEGFTETFYLNKHETKLVFYEIPKIDAVDPIFEEEDGVSVNLDLRSIGGSMPELYSKLCKKATAQACLDEF